MIGWQSPDTPASWPTKRRKFGRIFWFAVMMAFVVAVVIRIAIGPDEEQPKFAPALSIEERAPEGYFKVDGGYVSVDKF
jgi:hypothetical protein